MQGTTLGAVSRLWRYPVKSMMGEEVESAEVVWSGIFGNRSYALLDVETSRLVSAKNPAKWARVFECSSRLLDTGRVDDGLPAVQVSLPGGERFDIAAENNGRAESALSELFGRRVRFTTARTEPMAMTMEHRHLDIDEDPNAGKTTEYERPIDAQAGTFTDLAAFHLVTTASLRALADLYPAANLDPLRFRPDVLVDTGEANGFIETEWVGRTIALGDEVAIRVDRECGRCVMTTLPQGEIPSDPGVIRTLMRSNGGKLGVYASVLEGGRLSKGDSVAMQ